MPIAGTTLLTPEEISGKWKGNGCICTPEGDKLTITPACAGGVCVYRSCYGCPCRAQYFFKCTFGEAIGNCYDDGIGEGLLTPDANTVSRLNMCGAGYVRDDTGGGAPVTGTMMRA